MKNYSFDNNPDMLEDIVKNIIREHKETGKISEFNIFILLSHFEDRIKHSTMKNIDSELHPVSFEGVKESVISRKNILTKIEKGWKFILMAASVIVFFYYMEGIVERVMPEIDVKVFQIENRNGEGNATKDKQ